MNPVVMVLTGFGIGIFIMTIVSMYKWMLEYFNKNLV